MIIRTFTELAFSLNSLLMNYYIYNHADIDGIQNMLPLYL